MSRFLVRRLLLLAPVVLGVSTLVFFLIHLIPGDPVDLMLGETAQQVDRALLRHELHLDEPLLTQYGRFLGGLARADLGRSLHMRRPVVGLILERYPATLELAVAAMIIALAIAIPLGALAAAHHQKALDYLSLLFALVGASIPNFWLGPMLILFFSLHLGWLPVSGKDGLLHLILPAFTLGFAMSALLTRMTRSALLETMDREYITLARAKGLSKKSVLVKHAFKNALIPILTIVGLQFGGLLAGAIVTETIFSWPGIGRLMIQAIRSRDYPLVQGCVLLISFSYILINLATDLLYAAVDPRIRLQ